MIYCLEDDESIRQMLQYALGAAGFETECSARADEFYGLLAKRVPELILLDVMLPDEDGITVLKTLRKRGDTADVPVIMLTARSSEIDKVTGLDNGADDYITKPFGVLELISRVKALLRRSVRSDPSGELSVNGVTLNTEKHRVTVYGKEISLTLKEFELLRHLLQNRGIVFSRDKLLSVIWGVDFEGETRTVDVHIKSLRQKLCEGSGIIETVRGVGYKIREG
jgi:two-component system alkaline phosphatase synthesis response regulator PhoP